MNRGKYLFHTGPLFAPVRFLREAHEFQKRNFVNPAPHFFKVRILTNFSLKGSPWIETGTYLGNTTNFLSKRFPKIYTIEPSPTFFSLASKRFRKRKNIECLNGTSEAILKIVLEKSKPAVNIWLDGHFSEGGTFLGDTVSPIIAELEIISRAKNEFTEMALFVDDIRLFLDSKTGYPPFEFLVEWCTKNEFTWQIQSDILIAHRFQSLQD
jgi:hypothetical protein